MPPGLCKLRTLRPPLYLLRECRTQHPSTPVIICSGADEFGTFEPTGNQVRQLCACRCGGEKGYGIVDRDGHNPWEWLFLSSPNATDRYYDYGFGLEKNGG